MSEDLREIGDSRIEFIAAYILKTFKIKLEKWMKMYVVEESKNMILEFVEKNEQNLLVFYMSLSGSLVVAFEYPNQIKTKACFFAKKSKEAISKEFNLREFLVYGDLSYAPVDQLSSILDEVLIEYLSNRTKYINIGL